MSEHEQNTMDFWPKELGAEAARIASKDTRSAAHITANHGDRFPPIPTYEDVAAVGDALFKPKE